MLKQEICPSKEPVLKRMLCPTLYFYDIKARSLMIWHPPNEPEPLFPSKDNPDLIASSLGKLLLSFPTRI